MLCTMRDRQVEQPVEVHSSEDAPKGWRSWPWRLIGYAVGTAVPGAVAIVFALFLAAATLSGVHVDWEVWIEPVVFAVVAILAFVTLRPKPKIQSPQDRIKEVVRHLEATRGLLSALEDDLTTRTKVLQQLKDDAERYEKLTTLNAEQAKAIDDLVGRQLKRQSKVMWWQWIGSLVLAITFGFIVNWLSTPLLNWIIR
jgi:hypothetical protein